LICGKDCAWAPGFLRGCPKRGQTPWLAKRIWPKMADPREGVRPLFGQPLSGSHSMSRYRFELATAADDADLRNVLAQTPMEGRTAVTFRREPSYFAAAVVDGRFRQVIAARDGTTGRVVGFGSRSITERHVNGRPEPIGYLSSLRLLSAHRNHG